LFKVVTSELTFHIDFEKTPIPNTFSITLDLEAWEIKLLA